MPVGIQTKGPWGHGNVLSDQDAVDVAEFFSHKPRADFPGKVYWPNRPKPKGARSERLLKRWLGRGHF